MARKNGVCAVDGCDRSHYASGYCNPHWKRWKRNGTPGDAPIRSFGIGTCQFDGCERTYSAGGYCASHYAQSVRSGWLRPIRERNGPTSPRDLNLVNTYGISREIFDRMLAEQGGGCAVCGGLNMSGRELHVDHDHSCCKGGRSCGKCVRGLLCSRCNTGIGQFRDSGALLATAASYLVKYA